MTDQTLKQIAVGASVFSCLLLALVTLSVLGRETPLADTRPVEILFHDATIIALDPALVEAAAEKAAQQAAEGLAFPTWPPSAHGEPVPPALIELPSIPPHSQIDVTIDQDGRVEYSEPRPIGESSALAPRGNHESHEPDESVNTGEEI